jgi:hypothetical protein
MSRAALDNPIYRGPRGKEVRAYMPCFHTQNRKRPKVLGPLQRPEPGVMERLSLMYERFKQRGYTPLHRYHSIDFLNTLGTEHRLEGYPSFESNG